MAKKDKLTGTTPEDLSAAEEGATPVIAARAPQQARGKARVETILDATAAVLTENGVDGITMHGVAKRAKTPIGSMYHFFSDREALLHALQDRHHSRIQHIHEELRKTPDATWIALTARAVIERLMTPFVDYVEANPDCLILWNTLPRRPKDRKSDALGIRAAFAARLPHVDVAQREFYTETVQALAVGALTITCLAGSHPDVQQTGKFMREVMRAITAYMMMLEADLQKPAG